MDHTLALTISLASTLVLATAASGTYFYYRYRKPRTRHLCLTPEPFVFEAQVANLPVSVASPVYQLSITTPKLELLNIGDDTTFKESIFSATFGDPPHLTHSTDRLGSTVEHSSLGFTSKPKSAEAIKESISSPVVSTPRPSGEILSFPMPVVTAHSDSSIRTRLFVTHPTVPMDSPRLQVSTHADVQRKLTVKPYYSSPQLIAVPPRVAVASRAQNNDILTYIHAITAQDIKTPREPPIDSDPTIRCSPTLKTPCRILPFRSTSISKPRPLRPNTHSYQAWLTNVPNPMWTPAPVRAPKSVLKASTTLSTIRIIVVPPEENATEDGESGFVPIESDGFLSLPEAMHPARDIPLPEVKTPEPSSKADDDTQICGQLPSDVPKDVPLAHSPQAHIPQITSTTPSSQCNDFASNAAASRDNLNGLLPNLSVASVISSAPSTPRARRSIVVSVARPFSFAFDTCVDLDLTLSPPMGSPTSIATSTGFSPGKDALTPRFDHLRAVFEGREHALGKTVVKRSLLSM